MFKKTLAAAAVLGAFAGSAFAADVTLYGVIDTGFSYVHSKTDGSDATDTFQMKAGQQSGTRFGLKGTEELGNGMKVGFVLENGFDADDGTFDANGDNRIFGREALLFVEGAFGHLGFGRDGQLAGGAGSYGIAGSNIHPFSTGWGTVGGYSTVFGATAARFDNLITYKTPTFAGFTVFAQYSMDGNTQDKATLSSGVHGTENKSTVNRYYGIGAQYKAGAAEVVAIVDSINYASFNVDAAKHYADDSLSVTLGGNYNFGVAKLYVNGQYFDNAASMGKKNALQWTASSKNAKGEMYGVDGYGFNIGADVPALGGTAKVAFGYGHGEQDVVSGDKLELDTYIGTVGYIYNLSKRTAVYAAADYIYGDYNKAAEANTKDQKVTEVIFGMTHKF